ncbi:MAG: HD domain-containing protein [Coriobacteriales bacterium]|nr:HD domain-containing protein [Coriobacteriales bacterium]
MRKEENPPVTYWKLPDNMVERMERDRANVAWRNPWRCDDAAAFRRDPERDYPTLWRPAFVRDVEKIIHSPFFNRLSDKTQVFSLLKNDDITRRSLHVQLVSRIARDIGVALGLNADLIEAIALGHDIGHAPFGHTGEYFLNRLYHAQTGRFFDHNVQSVRVLDGVFRHNLSLQTLSGILCHNGESSLQEYRPRPLADFAELDTLLEKCYTHKVDLKKLTPSTLEGCVVRTSDMLAYLGKDRQDVQRAAKHAAVPTFKATKIGFSNAEIINNLSVDLITHSYGKDHLQLSADAFAMLKEVKQENYQLIYDNEQVNQTNRKLLGTMFERLYERLYADLLKGDVNSYIFRHHIKFIEQRRPRYRDTRTYQDEAPDQIVVDYIASMTDDYFIDLHNLLFPSASTIEYVSYFDPLPRA